MQKYSIVLYDTHFLESHESAVRVIVLYRFAHAIFGIGFRHYFCDLLVYFLALLHKFFDEFLVGLHS